MKAIANCFFFNYRRDALLLQEMFNTYSLSIMLTGKKKGKWHKERRKQVLKRMSWSAAVQ